MSPSISTFGGVPLDRLDPSGTLSLIAGRSLAGATPSARFRSLAGGLTRLSGLRTLTPSSLPSDPATMKSSNVKPKPSASNPQEGDGNG